MDPTLHSLPVGAVGAVGAKRLSVPLSADVDPVLVGLVAVLLLFVFMFFLLVRRTLKSFTEGMREGRRR